MNEWINNTLKHKIINTHIMNNTFINDKKGIILYNFIH